MSRNNPPSWAPNAIPTKSGWVDPKTNELLVAKKGLLAEATIVEPKGEQKVLGEVFIPEVQVTQQVIGEAELAEKEDTTEEKPVKKGIRKNIKTEE